MRRADVLVEPVVTTPDGLKPVPSRRGPRRWVVATAAATAAAVVVVGVWTLLRKDGGPDPSAAQPGTKTVPATRQNLVARQSVDGTIGYGGSYSVVNQASGIITALPDKGTVVEAGQALYRVDQRPVTLLYGDVPAWRALEVGVSDGADVRQLEANLVALGLATERRLAVDERFTTATSEAVRRWQKALGVEQTGVVALGDVAFLPGAIRVANLQGVEGAPAQPGALLTATSTTRVVQVDLDAQKQALVEVGDKVQVELPSGATTTGTVAGVGTVAEREGEGASAQDVIEVTVSLDDPAATGTLDQAPVKVRIESDFRPGVLAVPVNALLALREGGYGLRVAAGAQAMRIIAVETGLFASGMVEVSGEGLTDGMLVEVPAT